ncbi:MAG: hypothetical protein ACRDNE_01805 [Gaiellaceae bacterium]
MTDTPPSEKSVGPDSMSAVSSALPSQAGSSRSTAPTARAPTATRTRPYRRRNDTALGGVGETIRRHHGRYGWTSVETKLASARARS